MADPVRLERAPSGRSTCRATGTNIEKGAWRVGVEGWVGGRMSTIWQKPDAMLKGCEVEYSPNARSSCKKTSRKFDKGDVRFVVTAHNTRMYLTLEAAAQLLQPILEVVPDFSPTQLQGLAGLRAGDRQTFYSAFKVKPTDARKFDRSSPADEDEDNAGGPASKKAKKEPRDGDEDSAQEAAHSTASSVNSSHMPKTTAKRQSGGRRGEGSHKEAATAKQVEQETPTGGRAVGLTDYEREREDLIRKNRERLAELMLPKLVSELAATVAPSKPKPKTERGVSAKKLKATPAIVEPRRSLRVQGVGADPTLAAGVQQELRDGTVVLLGGAKPAGAPAQPAARHHTGPVPFTSENTHGPASDEAFLALLASLTSTTTTAPIVATPRSTAPAATRHRNSLQRLQRASLAAADVAKMTKDGIACMAFHPELQSGVLAAGDKAGKLGLWHVDHDVASSSGADEDYDGVLMFAPHMEYISALKWVGTTGAARKLLTASYDGNLMLLDPAAGGGGAFVPLPGLDPDEEFSSMEASSSGDTVFLGDPRGNFEVYDARAGKLAFEGLNVLSRKINTLHLEPSGSTLLAASCTDGTVTVWDIRNLTGSKKGWKHLSQVQHTQSCQAAYWAPDGSRRLLSTSFDDTLRIWHAEPAAGASSSDPAAGGAGLMQVVRMRHNNNTGRWLSPFRAVWGPEGDCCLVGDMKRWVQLFDRDGREAGRLQDEHMSAIPTRLCVHPTAGLLAAATASGRVHVFRLPVE